MRGDFSSWRDELDRNFNGVLHQQGRVLLDSDWNEQTRLTNDWQDTAAQDIIGANVAAVPAEAELRDSFRITRAYIDGTPQKVKLEVNVGRVWANGWLAELRDSHEPPATFVPRTATYLEPPLQDRVPALPTLGSNVRDAVILELWREELNGFQAQELLIEPALGGVDTTERVQTAMAFRLFRMEKGDTCDSIIPKLSDDLKGKGRLTVTLAPPPPGNGDCPLPAGGGYTGLEHQLYRIEIAQVDDGQPAMFKSSQFNGGLVGRGSFTGGASPKFTITANSSAILHSGLTNFYLEVLTPDAELGHWRVSYGAKVSLNDNELTVVGRTLFGIPPSTTGTVFFRLWNEVREISISTAIELPDGIRLQFAGGSYSPGDYWTFDVRAGEVANRLTEHDSPILIPNQLPAGIHYTRVPLGVIDWSNPNKPGDCRRIFQPLTRLATCCSYRVGDGKQSHGDFISIQDAINALPEEGGEVCVLPGLYEENIRIEGKHDITIKGCGARSRVKFKEAEGVEFPPAHPVFHVLHSQRIRIESLQIEAHPNAPGVLLEGPEMKADKQLSLLRDVTLQHLHIFARTRSAIEAHIGHFVTIRACRITMSDEPPPTEETEAAAVYFVGDDALIEENLVQVVSLRQMPINGLPSDEITLAFAAKYGHGGLHLGGGCERVRVINNLILSGVGNGITLGSVDFEEEQTRKPVRRNRSWRRPSTKPCQKRSSVPKRGSTGGGATTKEIAGPPLHDILIERNRIFRMGSNGIGVDAFFDLSGADEMISVSGLTIIGNEIRHCLNHDQEEIEANMVDSQGYGGIALADVDDLVVRDNVIEDNGPDWLEPICGIFVLHGEGIEIERNRIANNGVRKNQPVDMAQAGRRGGINIVYAIAPYRIAGGGAISPPSSGSQQIPFGLGLPAVKIHSNIVSVPLGRALTVYAVGPVSVVGNQFTTLGFVPRGDSSTRGATTVEILNLGLSEESGFQLLAFGAVRAGQVNPFSSAEASDPNVAALPEFDDLRLGEFLANGNVLFSNNQCALHLREAGLSLAGSSIRIFSLDDIGFHNNQCDCDLRGNTVLMQAFLFGISLRVSDNRFKETPNRAALSAVTLGLLNTTTDNQSTHCLVIRGGDPFVDRPNLILASASNPKFCDRFAVVLSDFAGGRARG